jgi:hypothetical protein
MSNAKFASYEIELTKFASYEIAVSYTWQGLSDLSYIWLYEIEVSMYIHKL